MKIRIERDIDTEKPVDGIIEDLLIACNDTAESLLYEEGLDDDDVADNIQRVAGEIFENVITKLAFKYNKEG